MTDTNENGWDFIIEAGGRPPAPEDVEKSLAMPYQIDPLEDFTSSARAAIIGACGFIPLFANKVALADPPVTGLAANADALAAEYGWPVKWDQAQYGEPQDGHKLPYVAENGRLYYPEDPPLAPLMVFQLQGCRFCVYQWGLVALISDTDKLASYARMD